MTLYLETTKLMRDSTTSLFTFVGGHQNHTYQHEKTPLPDE